MPEISDERSQPSALGAMMEATSAMRAAAKEAGDARGQAVLAAIEAVEAALHEAQVAVDGAVRQARAEQQGLAVPEGIGGQFWSPAEFTRAATAQAMSDVEEVLERASAKVHAAVDLAEQLIGEATDQGTQTVRDAADAGRRRVDEVSRRGGEEPEPESVQSGRETALLRVTSSENAMLGVVARGPEQARASVSISSEAVLLELATIRTTATAEIRGGSVKPLPTLANLPPKGRSRHASGRTGVLELIQGGVTERRGPS